MRVTCVPAPMYFSSVSKLGYDISFIIADFCSSTLYLFGFFNYFDLSVTDESYVDETRVWRIKL